MWWSYLLLISLFDHALAALRSLLPLHSLIWKRLSTCLVLNFGSSDSDHSFSSIRTHECHWYRCHHDVRYLSIALVFLGSFPSIDYDSLFIFDTSSSDIKMSTVGALIISCSILNYIILQGYLVSIREVLTIAMHSELTRFVAAMFSLGWTIVGYLVILW